MTIKAFFTAQEQKQIALMRDSGTSIKKIAITLRRSRTNVAIFLNNPVEYAKLKIQAEQNGGPVTPNKKNKSSKPENAGKKTPKSANKVKSPTKYSKTSASSTTTGSGASSSTQKLTSRDLAEFNKVIVEHRCVIKFYTKLGERPPQIYANLKKVYSPLHPPLAAVKYWATQFRKGRQTILNDTKMVRKLTKVNSQLLKSKNSKGSHKAKTKSKKSKSATVKNPQKATTNGAVREEEADDDASDDENANEEATKKSAVKKQVEAMKTFTIKLPGIDRLTKTLSM